MANCVFGWPIYSDEGVLYTPTFSGGSWEADLPLTNLQDRRLAKVARSTDAAAASTQVETDLGVARSIFVLAVPAHNISSNGTIRVRSSATAGSFTTAIYDTGTVSVWVTGLDAENTDGMNLGWTHVCTAVATARYWLVEITDTGNADGYVELGRLVIAGGWQPSYNLAYGLKAGLETETARQLTDGGAAFYTTRPVRRTIVTALNDLPEDEALQNAFDMQRIAGTSGQLMFVFDPDDTTHMHRRAFLATWRELGGFTMANLARYGIPVSLVEEL